MKMKNHNTDFNLKMVTFFVVFFSIMFQAKENFAQFAYGADVGWLSQMEDAGYVFKDNSGNQKDCLQILKEKGINSLRFRVWVNPSNKYCSKRDVAYMAKRAADMGFDILIDFHLADSWADPSKQPIPAAWKKDSSNYQALASDIYNHVHDVLDTLKSLGVTPKWVQIGNETNDGTLWETGRASKHMSNFAAMIKSGYQAVKDIDSSIQVIVHLSNGHDDAMFRWMFDGLKNNGAQWDIIGMSVYPYWANLSWAVDDSLALVTMKDMIARYNTKVMVCEAGYLYNQPVEAKNYLLDLIAKTKSVGGLGVFYWEPECYNWQGYNLGAWDPTTKQPTAAMDAFFESNPTSVEENKVDADFNLNVYPNPFNPTTTIEYELPRATDVSVQIYDTLGKVVAQLVNEFENAGHFKIVWNAKDIPSGVYFCKIEAGNFVQTKKIVLVK